MSSAWQSADFRCLPVAVRTIPTESSCLTSFCAATVETPHADQDDASDFDTFADRQPEPLRR